MGAGHNDPLGYRARQTPHYASRSRCRPLTIRGLRDGEFIVVVDHGVQFPQPPKLLENLVVVPSTAELAQPIVQVSSIGFEAFTLLRQKGFILFPTDLAPDAQLRLVLMFMEQFPDRASEVNKVLTQVQQF